MFSTQSNCADTQTHCSNIIQSPSSSTQFIFIRFDSSVFSLHSVWFRCAIFNVEYMRFAVCDNATESEFNRLFNLRFEHFLLSHRFYIILLISFILERIQFLFVHSLLLTPLQFRSLSSVVIVLSRCKTPYHLDGNIVRRSYRFTQQML